MRNCGRKVHDMLYKIECIETGIYDYLETPMEFDIGQVIGIGMDGKGNILHWKIIGRE